MRDATRLRKDLRKMALFDEWQDELHRRRVHGDGPFIGFARFKTERAERLEREQVDHWLAVHEEDEQ